MMKLKNWQWSVAVMAGLGAADVGAQTGGVIFANYGTSWAAPWYVFGPPNQSSVALTALPPPSNLDLPLGNTLLAGTGFTAELWAGPEGAADGNLVYLARVPFRTGTGAGLVEAPASPVLIPFASAGQRVALQLRVYDNQNGTIPNWASVYANPSAIFGTSEILTSPPLSLSPVTLEGLKSYVLSVDGFALPLPALSASTGGAIHYSTLASPSRTVLAGETVTLKVEVPNPASTIQWRFQGNELINQTNQTLVLNNIQFAQAGAYSAVTRVTVLGRPATGTNAIQLLVSEGRLAEPRLVSGGFAARIDGITNRAVAIETSTNLLNWIPWRTQWVGFPGFGSSFQNTFTNPPTVLFTPLLFHRTRVLP